MQRSEAASPVLTTAPVLGSRSISEPWFALATHVSLLRGARRPRRKLPVGGLSVLFEGTDTADWSAAQLLDSVASNLAAGFLIEF